MFNKRVSILALAGSALSGVVVNPSPAAAATVCNSPTNYFGTTFAGGIVVPPGGRCFIIASTVDGPVIVGAGGTFGAITGSVINGSLTAQRAQTSLGDVKVRGSVLLQQPTVSATGLPELSGAICGATIAGSLVVQAAPNDPRAPFLVGGAAGRYSCPVGAGVHNIVGGDIVVQGNQVPTSVAENSVGGRVICLGNNPAPFHAGNQPASRTYGQCAES